MIFYMFDGLYRRKEGILCRFMLIIHVGLDPPWFGRVLGRGFGTKFGPIFVKVEDFFEFEGLDCSFWLGS